MTTAIHIVCAGPPVAKGRPRSTIRGGRVVVYTPPKTLSFEAYVRQEAALVMRGREPLSGPLQLQYFAFMPIPQSWSKKKQREAHYVMTKPDFDNLAKIIDAIEGVVFTNDKIIQDAFIRKRYDRKPRVEITVQEMP